MSDSPDRIRADIEATRRELGSDVDALADKVTPSKIMDRQASRVRNAFSSGKDRLMGTASEAKEKVMGSASGAASSASDTVSDASRRAVEKAQGNPIAVGLIAFGVGLLAASLFPASNKEKELAENLKDAAKPLMDEVGEAAKQVGENLKEPAQEAASAVKDAATDAAGTVKSDATSAASDVTQRANQARDSI
jgi:gas vesicle protein